MKHVSTHTKLHTALALGAKMLIAAISLAALAVTGTGCASNAAKADKGTAVHSKNAYYESNIRDFATTSLSNGIPVVYKRQQGKTAWVGIVIDGGAVLVPQEKAGLENIALSLMLHGSEQYAYSTMQSIEYQKSFSLASSTGKDYAVLSLTCISRDLNEALSILADSFLHPLLQESDFDTIVTNAREVIQQDMSNPSEVLGLELAKAAYKNHPYASYVTATSDTIGNITLEDVRAHHQTLLNAERISLVAVGDFDSKAQKKLTAAFEGFFGSIERKSYERPTIPPLVVDAAISTVYASCEAAGDTGYIAGLLACPERTSDEYVAFAIAGMYLQDLFFRIVREQHSAVYSIGTGVIGGKQLLGAISVFKATEKEQLQAYINEAIAQFPDEEAVKATLDRYKNKYITTLFSASQTVSGVAGNVVRSLVYYGAPTDYLNRSAQVQAVTAKDVQDAYRKYFARTADRALDGNINPIQWVVVSGKEAVHSFTFE